MTSGTKRPEFPDMVTHEASASSKVQPNTPLEDSGRDSSGHLNLNTEFAFVDGNIELQTSDESFWVHEYQLKKFSTFSELIEEARRNQTKPTSNGRIVLPCNSSSVDICNTLRVVYTSVQSLPNFDVITLKSVLRVATHYGNPGLQAFAITGLEKAALQPIERIRLSDEFSFLPWGPPALVELCQRTEPISASEAQVLGIDRLTDIARKREDARRPQIMATIMRPMSFLYQKYRPGPGSTQEPVLHDA